MVVSGKEKDYKAGKGHAQDHGILECLEYWGKLRLEVFYGQQQGKPQRILW